MRTITSQFAPPSSVILMPLFLLLLMGCMLRTFAQQEGAYYNGQPRRDSQAHEDAESASTMCHPDWQWLCEDGQQCIAQYDVCDGIAQCVDHSDERNCGSRNRFSSHRVESLASNPRHPSPPEAPQPHSTPKTAIHTSSPAKHGDSILETTRMRTDYLLAGLAVLVLLAGLVHWVMKTRRRRQLTRAGVRGFRKGESLVEDEDDLLISQMYT